MFKAQIFYTFFHLAIIVNILSANSPLLMIALRMEDLMPPTPPPPHLVQISDRCHIVHFQMYMNVVPGLIAMSGMPPRPILI